MFLCGLTQSKLINGIGNQVIRQYVIERLFHIACNSFWFNKKWPACFCAGGIKSESALGVDAIWGNNMHPVTQSGSEG